MHVSSSPRHGIVGVRPAVDFAVRLERYGNASALVTAEGVLSYRQLAERVADTVTRLGPDRRLVLLAAGSTVDSVVGYLAALSAGHPVIVVPAGPGPTMGAVIDQYDPDVVMAGPADAFEERRSGSTHPMHRDLAALLSTSGSTGSAKLVRLSHRNIETNAEAIAEYLRIRPSDRAATTLPLSYCYGLSVLNSYLLRGASIILTDESVANPAFWDMFTGLGGTSFAGVPHTFDLLDRVGFADMSLPRLRYVTQAGGRMPAEQVARFAALGRRRGWDLFVMYGQTEATARMAYLPPRLAVEHPSCIGVPIPGGSFRLRPVPEADPGTGELVYSGPNVMLGYAERKADLALGRTVDELSTSDIGRLTDAGLLEIVGRRSRMLKIFGLRIDLERVEQRLAGAGITATCVGDDSELVVAVVGPPDPKNAGSAAVQELAAQASGLPARVIRVARVAELPRLGNGKPDLVALRALSRAPEPSGELPVGTDLRQIYVEVLGRPDATEESTFVSLGGDSLSYVEMSIRIEQELGQLPPEWPTTPIAALRTARRGRGRRRVGRRLETSVTLRAIAMVLVVGTHAGLFNLLGGAHLMLGIVGYNFGRFQMVATSRQQRVRSIVRSAVRLAIPTVLISALIYVAFDDLSWSNLFLGNFIVGLDGLRHEWIYWFVDTVVYTTLAMAVLLSTPWGDRWERRWPFATPVSLLLLGLVFRYNLVPGVDLHSRWINEQYTPFVVFWLFAIGWALAKANRTWHRVLISVAVVAIVPGFFGDLSREAIIMVGLLLLTWFPTLPSIRIANAAFGAVAAASLYIYLTHYMVLPRIDRVMSHVVSEGGRFTPILCVVTSIVVGIGVSAGVNRTANWVNRLRHAPSARRPAKHRLL